MRRRELALADLHQAQGPRLNDDDVHVWAADLAIFPEVDPSLSSLLTRDEEERAGRFHFADDQRRFRVGRALLRRALALYSGEDAGALVFRQDPFGKPRVDGAAGIIDFNVSHSGDLVLLAFRRGGAVGVDVERIRADLNLRELAVQCFTAAEQALIFEREDTAPARFFMHWASKEAWIKADGRGLGLPLNEHALTAIDTGTFAIAGADGRLEWRLHPLELRPGYAAAVCSGGSAWTPTLMWCRPGRGSS